MDYYMTASNWYKTVPDIYADGQELLIADVSIDTVLLIDVLEHIPSPDLCLSEIYRVLKPQGKLVVHAHFLYPIHDVPLDFHRWTRHGLERILLKHNLCITVLHIDGNTFETCALLINFALSNTLLWSIKNKNSLLIVAVVISVFIPLINLAGFILVIIFPDNSYMPYRYRIIASKT